MPCIALGAIVEVDDGSADAFVAIDDIVNLTVPDEEFGVVESKRLNQSANKTIQKLVTMKDPGEISFQYEFGAVKFLRLNTLKGTAKNWKITLPSDGADDEVVWTLPGILRSNKVEPVSPDEIQMVTATIVVTGAATSIA